MFKVYVQCDKFSFQNERGFLVVAEEGEFFFVHQVVPWIPKENKRKHPEVRKGNMYGYRELYDITMTLSVTRCK